MKLHKYTYSQLIELALCVPEPGSVNFNILHAVLQSLLKELGIQGIKPWSDIQQAVALKGALLTPRPIRGRGRQTQSDESLNREEEVPGDLSETWKPPTNEEIRAAAGKGVSAEEKAKIVSEIWQATNLSRRVDAAEEGIDKLASLMDSVIEEFDALNHLVLNEMKTKFDELFSEGGIGEFKESIISLKKAVEDLEDKKAALSEQLEIARLAQELKSRLDILEESVAGKIDREEVKPDLDLMRQKFGEYDEMLKTMPEQVKYLKELCDTLGEQVRSNKERLDDMGKELASLLEKIEELSKSSEMAKQIQEILDKLKRVEEEMEELSRASAELMDDNASRQLLIEELQTSLANLKLGKADKEELYNLLSEKADLLQLEDKVGRTDFDKVIDELSSTLQDLFTKFAINEQTWKMAVEELTAALEDKLSRMEFDQLQAPVLNHLKSIMASLKKLRTAVNKSLFPGAAGVTKCISCGRPAVLAGRDISISGGPDGDEDMKNLDQNVRLGLDVRGVSPYDPTSSGPSVISLPDESLRKEVDLVGYDGRLYKGAVKMKHHETDDRDYNVRVQCLNRGANKGPRRPSSQTGSALGQSRTSLTGRHSGDSRRHSKRPPGTPKFAFGKNEETEYTPEKRFAGGTHTLTRPSQRGLEYAHFVVPGSASKEDMGLMGYDKEMYKGSVKVQPKRDDDDEDLSPEVKQLIEAEEPEGKGRPVVNLEPRFCGGLHTVTRPQQRGLQYSKMKIEDEPREDTYLIGTDKNVYKGEEPIGPYGKTSRFAIKEVDNKTKPSVITKRWWGPAPVVPNDEPALIEAFYSKGLSLEPVRKQVDLVGYDGQVYKGCIVEIPPNEMKRANRPRGNRKHIYLPTWWGEK